MSIEVGRSLIPVFVRDSSREIESGTSFEEVERLAEEVADTKPSFPELGDVLKYVLHNSSRHSEVVGDLRAEGRFLLGISAGRGFANTESLGGLLYAEGSGPESKEENGLQVIRMGTWIRERVVSEEDREDVRAQLVDMSLSDVRTSRVVRVGIPVSRTTLVKPFHASKKHPARGYIYGHAKEEAAVARLDLPEGLGKLISFVTRAWHQSEDGDGQGNFGKVQDDLHDQWFS